MKRKVIEMLSSSGSRDQKKIDLSGKSIARLKRGNKKFEIIIDPELAFKYKTGLLKLEQLDMHEILEIDIVFTDASKGTKASQEELDLFGENLTIYEVAKIIINKGI